MLRIDCFDNEFSTQNNIEKNPLNDIVMLDGFIVPISKLPPEYQERVREARVQGKDISFRTR